MYLALTEQELDALQGRDYVLTVLYMYLKRFMDYDTGIVGNKRLISYQGMSEALYIEPRAGVKTVNPSKQAIRRMLDQLVKYSLLRKHRQDTLVFLLPLADTQNYVQKKADRGAIPKADTKKGLDSSTVKEVAKKADTLKTKKPTHLTSHYINYQPTTTNNLPSSNQEQPQSSSSHNLIFSKRLDTETTNAMRNLVKGFEDEQQQELIDEVHGYLERGKVQSTPLALLYGMVERCKAGAFIPNYAPKVKAAREQRKQEAIAASQPKPVSNKQTKPARVTKLTDYLKKGTA